MVAASYQHIPTVAKPTAEPATIMLYSLRLTGKNTLIKIINSMLTKKRMKDLLDGEMKL